MNKLTQAQCLKPRTSGSRRGSRLDSSNRKEVVRQALSFPALTLHTRPLGQQQQQQPSDRFFLKNYRSPHQPHFHVDQKGDVVIFRKISAEQYNCQIAAHMKEGEDPEQRM